MPYQTFDEGAGRRFRQVLCDFKTLNEVEPSPEIDWIREIGYPQFALVDEQRILVHIIAIEPEHFLCARSLPFPKPSSLAAAEIDDALHIKI